MKFGPNSILEVIYTYIASEDEKDCPKPKEITHSFPFHMM